jgi:hypothetical protein
MIEQKYAKIINKATKLCSVAVGTDEAFYIKEGFEKKDVELSYDGNWYLAGYAPTKPQNQVIIEQIEELESQVTDRNIRSAMLGDQYALNKITQVEAQIEELRKQLESQGGQ